MTAFNDIIKVDLSNIWKWLLHLYCGSQSRSIHNRFQLLKWTVMTNVSTYLLDMFPILSQLNSFYNALSMTYRLCTVFSSCMCFAGENKDGITLPAIVKRKIKVRKKAGVSVLQNTSQQICWAHWGAQIWTNCSTVAKFNDQGVQREEITTHGDAKDRGFLYNMKIRRQGHGLFIVQRQSSTKHRTKDYRCCPSCPDYYTNNTKKFCDKFFYSTIRHDPSIT